MSELHDNIRKALVPHVQPMNDVSSPQEAMDWCKDEQGTWCCINGDYWYIEVDIPRVIEAFKQLGWHPPHAPLDIQDNKEPTLKVTVDGHTTELKLGETYQQAKARLRSGIEGEK